MPYRVAPGRRDDAAGVVDDRSPAADAAAAAGAADAVDWPSPLVENAGADGEAAVAAAAANRLRQNADAVRAQCVSIAAEVRDVDRRMLSAACRRRRRRPCRTRRRRRSDASADREAAIAAAAADRLREDAVGIVAARSRLCRRSPVGDGDRGRRAAAAAGAADARIAPARRAVEKLTRSPRRAKPPLPPPPPIDCARMPSDIGRRRSSIAARVVDGDLHDAAAARRRPPAPAAADRDFAVAAGAENAAGDREAAVAAAAADRLGRRCRSNCRRWSRSMLPRSS